VKLHHKELSPICHEYIPTPFDAELPSIVYRLVSTPQDCADTLEFWLNAFGYGGTMFMSSNNDYVRRAIFFGNMKCADYLRKHKSPRSIEQFDPAQFIKEHCDRDAISSFYDQVISSMSFADFKKVTHKSCSGGCDFARDPIARWDKIARSKSTRVFVFVCMISRNLLAIK